MCSRTFPTRNILLILGLAALVEMASNVPIAWAQGEIFVANSGNSTITVYERTASGNVNPLRTIGGGASGLVLPQSLAVDTVNNELVVGNLGTDSVLVFSRTAASIGPPLRILPGLSHPFGVAVDSVNDELLVVNFFNDSIAVYPRTASGSTPPLGTISGGATRLLDPSGLSLDIVINEIAVTNINDSITV